MQKRNRYAAFLLAAGLGLAPTAAGADDAESGRAALDAARAAYAAAGELTETLELALEMPDGRTEEKSWTYGVGAGGSAFFTLWIEGAAAIRVVAAGDRVVAVESRSPERYAEAPYDGDFAAALARLGGDQVGLVAPPAVVAAQGGDLDAFVEALRLGVLGPLEVAGAGPAPELPGAAEVHLVAEGGELFLTLDGETRLPRRIRVTLGEGEQRVRAAGRYRIERGDPGAALVPPDTSGRVAAGSFAELEAGDYPLGEPAPEISLPTLAGDELALADLRGSVVVLDFWATWCVPCWTALEHTEKLAAWAAESALPVAVFAVDSLENTDSLAAQRRRAEEFLTSRDLDLPVLLDPDDTAFAAFHNPGLPSLVIVDREGRLASYHSGSIPEMVETVRAEVEALLE